MALTSATVTMNLSDMLGVDFDARRTKVWVETNVPGDTVIDTIGNLIRLGSGVVTVAIDGTASFSTWVPGSGSNPASWQTTVNVDYADPGTRQRVVRAFGPFTITGNADLADLVAEQEIPPTYLSEVSGALSGFVDEAEAAQAAAEAAAALAVDISGISTSDDVVEVLVKPGAAGPKTKAALAASYAGVENLRQVQGSPISPTGPVVTFIDDDGDARYLDIWAPILLEKGIKISVAVVGAWATNPGYLSLAQMLTIQDQGHDILSHSWEHLDSNSPSSTVELLDEDWSHNQTWMRENGLAANSDVLVYPGGLLADNVAKKNVARKYYRYAVTTYGATEKPSSPVDNWAVKRTDGDAQTEAELKTRINEAVAVGGWLIIMTHDQQLDTTLGGRAAQMTKLRNVIDYCGTVGATILKFSDAEKIKGNAVAIGERTDPASTFVTHLGKSNAPVVTRGLFTPTLFGSTVAGAHTYTDRSGAYQVVGGMMTVKGQIRIDPAGLDAAMAGNLRIGGLPAVSLAALEGIASCGPLDYNIFDLGAGYTSIVAKIAGATSMSLLKIGNNVSANFVSKAAIPAGQPVILTFVLTYMVRDAAWGDVF